MRSRSIDIRIRQIQDQDATSRLGVDELAQFVHMVRDKFTADRELNGSAARAMNFQHRPRRSERNFQAIRTVPERFTRALALACESGSC